MAGVVWRRPARTPLLTVNREPTRWRRPPVVTAPKAEAVAPAASGASVPAPEDAVLYQQACLRWRHAVEEERMLEWRKAGLRQLLRSARRLMAQVAIAPGRGPVTSEAEAIESVVLRRPTIVERLSRRGGQVPYVWQRRAPASPPEGYYPPHHGGARRGEVERRAHLRSPFLARSIHPVHLVQNAMIALAARQRPVPSRVVPPVPPPQSLRDVLDLKRWMGFSTYVVFPLVALASIIYFNTVTVFSTQLAEARLITDYDEWLNRKPHNDFIRTDQRRHGHRGR